MTKLPVPVNCWHFAGITANATRGTTPASYDLCEVLTEFNVFDGDQRSMFVRLQVPVEFCKTP